MPLLPLNPPFILPFLQLPDPLLLFLRRLPGDHLLPQPRDLHAQLTPACIFVCRLLTAVVGLDQQRVVLGAVPRRAERTMQSRWDEGQEAVEVHT